MSAGTALLIVVLLLMMIYTIGWPRASPLPAGEVAILEQPLIEPPMIIGPYSAYDYGVSYTYSPDYIPAYSYGTTREYRRTHGRYVHMPRGGPAPSQYARNTTGMRMRGVGGMGGRGSRWDRGGDQARPIEPPMGRPKPLPGAFATHQPKRGPPAIQRTAPTASPGGRSLPTPGGRPLPMPGGGPLPMMKKRE